MPILCCIGASIILLYIKGIFYFICKIWFVVFGFLQLSPGTPQYFAGFMVLANFICVLALFIFKMFNAIRVSCSGSDMV